MTTPSGFKGREHYMINVITDELFYNIHGHSHFSNLRMLDCTNTIDKTIKRVNELGQKGFALTDHESLSGHVELIQTVSEMKKKGEIPKDFKPILGNEIYLVEESITLEEVRQDKHQFYHFILLAKDAEGHRLLRELSSRAWLRSYYSRGMERVPTFYTDIEEVVGANKGHLIASTACLGSYIAQNILRMLESTDPSTIQGYKDNVNNFISWAIGIFGKEDFYIEIQPSLQKEQIEYNKVAIKVAEAWGLRYVVTTDAHYLTEEDRAIHKAYLTSDDKEGSNREVDDFYSSTFFFSVDKLRSYLDYLTDEEFYNAVYSTKLISDKIEIYDLYNNQEIPKIKLPDSFLVDFDLLNYSSELGLSNIVEMGKSEVAEDRFFIHKIFLGVKKYISDLDLEATMRRVNVECGEVIGISEAKNVHMSSYFTTMQKNIDIIWEEANSLVGCGRGSAGGFIIDYLLGITQINPLKQGVDMPHWRFISAERPDYPDIDIDIPSHKKEIVYNKVRDYYRSIGGDVVRVCSFGTVTSKSAIQTACRGLDIGLDIGLYLSSLVPIERGNVWSINDCYYGDKSKKRKPVDEFVKVIDEYEGLLEIVLGVEGLINQRSSHPCGVLLINGDFTDKNAMMKAPNGDIISQFALYESEYLGNIKYDFLNTKTMSMIQLTLELLIEHGEVEYEGTLRNTYDKLLHPDNIDANDPEIWELLNSSELLSAFQFDSDVGEQAIKSIHPSSLLEAADGNNLMRLMGEEGEELPIEKYVRFKNDIAKWYKEMEDFGLNSDEIEIMKSHLLKNYGVCSTQEDMMLLSMNPNVSNFNVLQSNILRKGVAKKIGEKFEEAHQLFYESGLKLGTNKKLLDYIWDVQIAMQRGYGFSLLHSIEYTYILVQQLKLIKDYNPLYWNTAVLTVKGSAIENEVEDAKKRNTDYGAIASAIGYVKEHEIKVSLPDINIANFGFSPNTELNSIVFGLKGINGVGDAAVEEIVEKRPYTSLSNFLEKATKVSRTSVIKLIKAGAFDKLEDKPREVIMANYLHSINTKDSASKVTFATIDNLRKVGLIEEWSEPMLRLYYFHKDVLNNKHKYDRIKNKIRYLLPNDERTQTFFNENVIELLKEGEDYEYTNSGLVYFKSSLEKAVKNAIAPLTKWLYSDIIKDRYNELSSNLLFNQDWEKYCKGSISTWEMDALCFYYHSHELIDIDRDKYGVVDFNTLPEQPDFFESYWKNGKEFKKFQLYRIAGTVLDRNKNRHTVSLLTNEGVVKIKFYQGAFAFYDRQISRFDETTGKNKTIEKSWFTRGEKLFVVGYRRDDQFIPRKYASSIYQHTVTKIEEIYDDGSVRTKSEREWV